MKFHPLTPAQRARFWREWSNVCSLQGWTKQDGLTQPEIDAHRHALLNRAGFTSLTLVDNTRGFDRVLAELGRLADNLARTAELDNPEPGLRRNYLHNIAEYERQLAPDYAGPPYHSPYLLSIFTTTLHVVPGYTPIETLPTDDLFKVMITLEQRLKTHKNKTVQAAAPAGPSGVSPEIPSLELEPTNPF